MPPIKDCIIVRRDGQAALSVSEDGRGWHVQPGVAGQVCFLLAFRPGNDRIAGVITVAAPRDPRLRLESEYFGLPRDLDGMLEILTECAIGERLDQDPEWPHSDPSSPPIGFSPEYLRSVRERARTSDQGTLDYLQAKTIAAWRFGQRWANISFADQLRLGRPLTDLQRLAEVELEVQWTFAFDPQPGGFALKPSPELLRAVQRRRASRVGGGLCFDVRSEPEAPRYQPVAVQFEKALRYLEAGEDLESAAKNAISALESAARIVAGGGATCGDALSRLRASGRIDPTLGRALEVVWGFTNQAPGVRHGHPNDAALEAAQARLVVNMSAAGILYLLSIDR